jgi:hypothetical protein
MDIGRRYGVPADEAMVNIDRDPQCQQRSPLGLTRPPGGLTNDHATAL